MTEDSKKSIVLFEDFPVRRMWMEEEERWYFAIVDIVSVLTDSKDPAGYIKDMRRRDEELSKGWGQIATPFRPNKRWSAEAQLRDRRGYLQNRSVYSVKEG